MRLRSSQSLVAWQDIGGVFELGDHIFSLTCRCNSARAAGLAACRILGHKWDIRS